MSTDPKRSAAARLSRLLVNLVLVSVTLVATAYLIPTVLGYDRYVITGGSMEGARSGSIEKGSVALTEKVAVPDLAVGDVITYQPPADSGVSNLVTHRITSIRDRVDGSRVFRTQGDANPDPDPWRFTLDQGTQARVSYAVPHVGYAVIALADRDTRVLLVGAPAALVALLCLVDAGLALRSRREDGGGADRREPATAGGIVPTPRMPAAVPAPRSAIS